MASWVEKDSSRQYTTRGRDIEVVMRRFIVLDVLPWEATRLAEPPLPTFGDRLPARAAAGGRLNIGGIRSDAFFQVRDVQAGYAPGSNTDSEVLITYASGPNWQEHGGKRLVEWSIDSGAESDVTHVDNAGVYVPDGLPIFVPTVTIRARLEGAAVPRGVDSSVGQFNKYPFRLYAPRHVMFAGVSARGTVSNDYLYGRNDVEYEFITKPGGWTHRRPKKNSAGLIVLGADGLPIMTEHETGKELDFRKLFPPTFEPGHWTFYDFYYPVIP